MAGFDFKFLHGRTICTQSSRTTIKPTTCAHSAILAPISSLHGHTYVDFFHANLWNKHSLANDWKTIHVQKPMHWVHVLMCLVNDNPVYTGDACQGFTGDTCEPLQALFSAFRGLFLSHVPIFPTTWVSIKPMQFGAAFAVDRAELANMPWWIVVRRPLL